MKDISVIITAHREGVISGATARSAQNAISAVTAAGASTETIIVLDRSDEVTKEVLSHSFSKEATILFSDFGDPGLARNLGVERAQGSFSTFLDGDDLWSENWLVAAWNMGKDRPDAALHSHCNVVFGQERNFWWHIDSEGPLYDPDYMRWANYWDAMSFASTDIYRRFPFRPNDLKNGFGHEDWLWNVDTLKNGISHKPVLETVHFKRRRAGSQMAQVAKADATIRPF